MTPAATAQEEIFGMNSELWLCFPLIPSSSQQDGSGIAGNEAALHLFSGKLSSKSSFGFGCWLQNGSQEIHQQNMNEKNPESEELKEEKFGSSVGIGD